METATSMEERIQAMVEKALSRVMASNATPVPSQSLGTVNLTGDGAEAGVRTRQKRGPEVRPPSSPLFTLRDGAAVGDHTQQKRGPEVGPPCSPFITIRDGAEVGDHTQQKRGPEVGPPCSPFITIRDGAEVGDHTQQKRGPEVGPPCFPIFTLRDVIAADVQSPLRQGPVIGRHCSPVNRAITSREPSGPFSILITHTDVSKWMAGELVDEDGSFKSEQNPFLAMPGLENCHLSGRLFLSQSMRLRPAIDREPCGLRPAAGGDTPS